MNSQWLTILMSKGIKLEQNLRQQVQERSDLLKNELEERGIRLSTSDFAALIEEVSPKASHAALSYALDLMRSFSSGMGLRVARLSDVQIELVIPARSRNLSESKTMHEGAITTAAIESAKILWMRHAPLGNFEIAVKQIEVELFKNTSTDCRLRTELSESLREVTLAEIRERRESTSELEIGVFDAKDLNLGRIHLVLNVKHTPALA